jgi:ketosteroid isomerase-like protein
MDGNPMRALVVAGWVLALALVPRAEAVPWESIRRGVIDPLNTALHRHLPQAIRARDLNAVVAIYAADTGTGLIWDAPRRVYPDAAEETLRWEDARGPEPIRERYARLIDLFATVDKAELRLDQVEWKAGDASGLPADAHLVVRGTRADGRRASLDQRMRWRIAARGGEWVVTAEEVTSRTLVTGTAPRFVDATAAAGLVNVHTNASSPVFQLFGDGSGGTSVGNSAGSAVADVDRDGCEDVFLAGDPDAALFRNDCEGHFTDVTVAAGLPRPFPAAASGAVFFDYDNDGWPDLYVAAVRGGDRLFHNEGGGRFADVTAEAGIPPGRWGSMVAVADYDRDGFLDVFVVRMGDHEKTVPIPNYDARNGVPSTLLHNERNGTFRDVSREAGVAYRGWDLAGAWGDYDGDGWPDLYVVNEFGGNALFRNRHDGTFRDVTAETGTADGGAGMGVAWADYDGDGDLDLLVSNMHANSRWALFHPDFPAPIPWPFKLIGLVTPEVQRRTGRILDLLTRGSTLYRNDGDGRFTDVSDAAGVRDMQWSWGVEFLDYDDDGHLDLYAVNGFISGPILDDV